MSRHVLVGVGLLLRSAVLACVVALGALAWRLSQGPLAIDFLVPQLERALAGATGGFRVRIGGASLVWDGSVHHLELRAEHVRLTSGGDAQVMTIPAVAIGVQPWALLRGAIEVGSVALVDPRLRLVRGPDGRFSLVGDDGGEIDVSTLPSFSGSDRETASSGTVPSIGVRNAAVTLVDGASGVAWEAADVTLEVHAQGGALIARLGGSLARGPGARTLPVTATVLFHRSSRTLAISESSFGLEGGGVLRLRGLVASTAGGYALVAKTRLVNVATNDLGRYWPESTAPRIRRWVVDNIRGGRIRDARGRVVATLPETAPSQPRIDSVVGSLTFDGVKARYLKTMPMANSLRGIARYTPRGTRFVITGGRIEGVEVARGSLRFTPPAARSQRLALDLIARGSLSQTLAVLAHEPVSITRALGRAASDFGGTADMRVSLDIPLASRVASRDVGVTASAVLRDVAVSRIAGDWSVREGDLTLGLRDGSLTLGGTARLEGVPIRLELRRRLGSATGTEIDLQARVDDTGRQALGLAAADWLVGPVPTSVRIVQRDATASTVDVDADLAPASLKLPVLAIDKRAEEPGKMRARLRIVGGAVTAIESGRLTVGDTEVNVNATRSDDRKTWRAIDVGARFAPMTGMVKGGSATLTIRPAEGHHRFDLESNDAGMLLRSLGYSDGRGGRVACEGTVELLAPDLTLDGRVHVERFTLTRSPIVARLLTLTSLSGIARVFDKDGIAFDRLDGSFAVRGSQLTLTQLTARGPSLAITIDGTVDRVANRLALRGALVPSYYGLNTAAARIPLVGKIVTGVGGEGVQVIAFRVDGPPATPEVRLDPTASLAPGVLRDLVGVLPGRGRE